MRRTAAGGASDDGRATRRVRRSGGRALGLLLTLGAFAAATVSGAVRGQERAGGVLAECAALSPLLDDIHTCLDDYLAVMDERLADIGRLVERTLDDEALAAFARSQGAFAAYRRDNCLWYLAFSGPPTEAEQIAKNCLATMSLDRLSELQRLLTENDGDAPKSGYYVYGAERNTFRPCGSEARYWVEGDVAVVGELQQSYLEIASDDRQVLFARLDGTLDDAAVAPDGHSGVLRARALTELRVPLESDCRLPGGAPLAADGIAADATPEPIAVAPVAPAPISEAAPDEPEQQLLAYFGAWLADCTESAGRRACALSTALESDAGGRAGADDAAAPTALDGAEDGRSGPTLSLTRRDGERTRIELVFPDREIDSPAKLRWSIDGAVFGDVVGSTIRVDETATRQIVDESALVEEELLPLLIAGDALVVDVLDSVDDADGERHRATLLGLTRALAFADDFVGEGGGS